MEYSVLEKNLDDDILREFKLELIYGLMLTGALVEKTLGLSEGRGVNLLMRTYALTRGLWQSLDYPPNVKALLADPVFAPIRPDSRTELMAALSEYWRGALAVSYIWKAKEALINLSAIPFESAMRALVSCEGALVLSIRKT